MPSHRTPALLIAGGLALAAVVLPAQSMAAAPPAFTAKQEMAAPVLGPFQAPRLNVRHMVLDSNGITVSKKNGSYIVRLRGVEDDTFAVRARRDKKVKGALFKVRTSNLPKLWYGRMGFNPNLAVTYKVNGATRTHYLRDLSRPSYDRKANSIVATVPATPNNMKVVTRMRPKSASSVRAVFEPSPIRSGPFKPGKADPAKRESQTSVITTNNAGYIPSSPNSAFTMPYTSVLGNGGQSWQNLLSANGQYTQGCETFGSGVQSAGDATTLGEIQIYETASEVQQALSVSGAVSYGTKMAKVSLDGGYSTTTSQDESSFYAVAMVSWQGATVNLGNPTISPEYTTAVAGIDTFSEALGMVSACGDSYPTSYQQGAVWASVLQITMSSSSDAENAYANISGNYGKTFSGSAAFSDAVSSTASSSAITETDQCWGPASCGSVPGYETPDSTVFSEAMATFTNNYNIMYANLAKLCSPSGDVANCITEMYYAPIQEAMPPATSFSANTPQNLVTSAAEGVYGVLQNLQAWSAEYQSIITANPTGPNVAQYQAAINALNEQGNACGMEYLQSPACSTVFQNCYSAMEYNPTYVQPACMPTAFTQNPNLANLTNPFYITGDEEVDQTASSTEKAPSERGRAGSTKES